MNHILHPDPSPFWVLAGDATCKERVRRILIEAAGWSDDAKETMHHHPTWNTARWTIVAKGAPPEAKEAAEARRGKSAGHVLEALVLNAAMLSDSETNPTERASALNWALHTIGDIHQPLYVSDQYSKEFPTGNDDSMLEWVADPMGNHMYQIISPLANWDPDY